MASCPACLSASLRRISRPSCRSFVSWFSAPPSTSPTAAPAPQQPVASTSRLPGSTPTSTSKQLPSRTQEKQLFQPPRRHKPVIDRRTERLKTRMVASLQTRKGREALRTLLDSLKDPTRSPPPDKAVGLAYLFFAYNKPELAVEAILKMHDLGYRIPPAMGVKLLKSAYHELVVDPNKLAVVVGWLQEGVANERRRGEGEALDVGLVLTVMDLLKQLGHAEWAMGIFQTWLQALPEGQVGPSMVWSQGISVLASVGELAGARELFYEWRKRWFELHRPFSSLPTSSPTSLPSSVAETAEVSSPGPSSLRPRPKPPPEQPYVTLLTAYATNVSTAPSHKDPINPILALIRRDDLPLSLNLLHALLRIELHRNRFFSFWGLWNKVEEGGWRRNQVSWSLAIKAKLQQDSLILRRARKRGSPLQTLLPDSYADARAPSPRELFRQFLEDHQQATSGRPSLQLALATGSVSSTKTLNRFLSLFIARGDWQGAAVVLETFGVHRVEPDMTTHGDVVVGVVRSWEKGKLRGELKEEEGLLEGAERSEASRLASGRMRKRAAQLGPGAGGELISRIIEQRQFRINMFVKNPLGSAGGEDEVQAQQAPSWMLVRERREMGYLFSLLRRSEGLDEVQWSEQMKETRREMLPRRWGAVERKRWAAEASVGEGEDVATVGNGR
ncbi:hypothetical protein BCR35DRAFT_309050 [Leucosporidium creatinivorum]|uniref:Uncharacterized protein n=1 Tax=Leucosporidium creatinivorum TaxID=106004 RepID=A0A1Y2DRN8_9BASI|nr:hypothetical protein BCR35DRAFT_309050 [Leucosporidium creatinivorum]